MYSLLSPFQSTVEPSHQHGTLFDFRSPRDPLDRENGRIKLASSQDESNFQNSPTNSRQMEFHSELLFRLQTCHLPLTAIQIAKKAKSGGHYAKKGLRIFWREFLDKFQNYLSLDYKLCLAPKIDIFPIFLRIFLRVNFALGLFLAYDGV